MTPSGKEAVNIPKFGTAPVHWGYSRDESRITLTFKQMMDIVKFSLDNAFFTLGHSITQQVHGIPMGDPLGPAICIGTCAHLEMEWFDNLPIETQSQVRFTRYLDDIFMVANRNAIPSYDKFLEDYTKQCYPPCLELGDQSDDEYLECKVHTKGNSLGATHWNKNYEHMCKTGRQYFYKHQHFWSYTTNHCKRGTLIGTWTRMKNNTTNNATLSAAIKEKVQELKTLGYPRKYIDNT